VLRNLIEDELRLADPSMARAIKEWEEEFWRSLVSYREKTYDH
jgi:hypothetical protein